VKLRSKYKIKIQKPLPTRLFLKLMNLFTNVLFLACLLSCIFLLSGVASFVQSDAKPTLVDIKTISNLTSANTGLNNVIQIIGQSPTVLPNQAFSLSLQINSATTSQSILDFYLYNKLDSRSAYFQSLTTPYGQFETTGPVNVSSDKLNFQIALNGSYSQINTSTNIYFHLNCTNCLGVYPLKVALLNPTTRQIESYVITHITVLPSTSLSKLNLALVLPFLYSNSNNVPNSSSYFATTNISEIENELKVLLEFKSASVNLNISPEGYRMLQSSSNSSLLALQKLLLKTAELGSKSLVENTFAPVNLSQMTDSSLGQNICGQFGAGLKVLHQISSNIEPTYVSNNDLSTGILGILSKCNITSLVINNKNLVPVSVQYGQSEPFLVANTQITGLESDQQLSHDISITQNPILQADNIIGDLAQLFYDFPNSQFNRVLVLNIGTNQNISPQFLQTLLSALTTNSVIGTTTTMEATTYPSGVLYNPSNRNLIAPKVPSLNLQLINQINNTVSGLNQINGSNPNNIPNLSAISINNVSEIEESYTLTPTQQQLWSKTLNSFADALKNQITLPQQQTITVAANTAQIPITIFQNKNSSSIYNVKVVLSDNGVIFQHGNSVILTLTKQQNTVYFTLSPRSVGSTNLTVSIESPSGNLTLLQQVYIIHSSAISILGLIITVGAALLIGWWWLKTFIRKRKLKHDLKT
jgi:hypothetical protein